MKRSTNTNIPLAVGRNSNRATSIPRISNKGLRTPNVVAGKKCSSVTPISSRGSHLTVGSTSASKSSSYKPKDFRGLSPRVVYKDKQKISSYIRDVQVFVETNLDISESIKPLSIKVFIQIMTVILEQIFSKDSMEVINQNNYKEIIIKYAKILECPFTPTISTLKGVSSTHCFPQIITFIAWMIHLLNDIPEDSPTEEEVQYMKLSDVLFDYKRLQYLKDYNGSSENNDENIQTLRRQFADTLDFHDNSLEKIEEELRSVEKSNKNIQRDLEEIQGNRIQTERKAAALKQDITDAYEQLLIYEDKLPKLRKNIKRISLENDAILPEIEKLEPITKLISAKELHIKKKRIQDLKDALIRNRQYYEKLNDIGTERLNVCSGLQNMVQSEIDKWNLFVVNTPEMRGLQLRQTRILLEDFIKDIDEIKQKKTDIESRIEIRLVKQKSDDFEIKREIISKTNVLEVFNKEVSDLSSDMVVLQLEWEDLTNKAHQLSEELKDHRRNHQHEYEEIRKSFVKDLETLQKIEADCRKELAEIIKNIQDYELNGTAYLIEFHNTTVADIAKIYECVENIKRMKNKSLEEANSKMCQELNITNEFLKMYSTYKDVIDNDN